MIRALNFVGSIFLVWNFIIFILREGIDVCYLVIYNKVILLVMQLMSSN